MWLAGLRHRCLTGVMAIGVIRLLMAVSQIFFMMLDRIIDLKLD
jgi:hypothetical protein